jgi:general secretion pathway protein F
MNAYQYTAITQAGKECKGVMQADNEKALRQLLRAQSLIPLTISPVTEKNTGFALFSRRTISVKSLTLMTRQLATLLEADIPLVESLDCLSQQATLPRVKELVLALMAKVTEGYSLSQALDDFPDTFSTLYRSSVAAGEASGDLARILLSLADYLEEQQALRAKVTQAMIYPSFVMMIAFVFTIILMVTVVPRMLDVFADQEQELPAVTQVLLVISTVFKKAWWVLALLAVGGWIGFKKYCSLPQRRARWHDFCGRVPGLGSMIMTVQTARFLRTLSLLLQAGVPLLEALAAANRVVTHLPMQAALESVQQEVREGLSLKTALEKTGYFSAMSMHMIASGERAGHLESMMQRAAKQQETEVEQTLSKGLALFEPIMILVMGLVVLFIVLAVLLPVFSATQMF